MIEILGVALEDWNQRFHDLLYGLVKFRLVWVSGDHAPNKLLREKLLDWTHWAYLLGDWVIERRPSNLSSSILRILHQLGACKDLVMWFTNAVGARSMTWTKPTA
jgi:hypothetical protein